MKLIACVALCVSLCQGLPIAHHTPRFVGGKSVYSSLVQAKASSKATGENSVCTLGELKKAVELAEEDSDGLTFKDDEVSKDCQILEPMYNHAIGNKAGIVRVTCNGPYVDKAAIGKGDEAELSGPICSATGKGGPKKDEDSGSSTKHVEHQESGSGSGATCGEKESPCCTNCPAGEDGNKPDWCKSKRYECNTTHKCGQDYVTSQCEASESFLSVFEKVQATPAGLAGIALFGKVKDKDDKPPMLSFFAMGKAPDVTEDLGAGVLSSAQDGEKTCIQKEAEGHIEHLLSPTEETKEDKGCSMLDDAVKTLFEDIPHIQCSALLVTASEENEGGTSAICVALGKPTKDEDSSGSSGSTKVEVNNESGNDKDKQSCVDSEKSECNTGVDAPDEDWCTAAKEAGCPCTEYIAEKCEE